MTEDEILDLFLGREERAAIERRIQRVQQVRFSEAEIRESIRDCTRRGREALKILRASQSADRARLEASWVSREGIRRGA